MPLSIELPTPLDEELAIEAEREGVSVSEEATLLLHLMTAFTRDGRKTLFRSVVRSFLEQNEIDADQMAKVCEGLLAICLRDESQRSDGFENMLNHEDYQIDADHALSLLGGWRSSDVHQSLSETIDISVSVLPPLGHLIQRAGRSRRDSVMGKYGWIKGSSEDHAIEKQQEIAREDRRR